MTRPPTHKISALIGVSGLALATTLMLGNGGERPVRPPGGEEPVPVVERSRSGGEPQAINLSTQARVAPDPGARIVVIDSFGLLCRGAEIAMSGPSALRWVGADDAGEIRLQGPLSSFIVHVPGKAGCVFYDVTALTANDEYALRRLRLPEPTCDGYLTGISDWFGTPEIVLKTALYLPDRCPADLQEACAARFGRQPAFRIAVGANGAFAYSGTSLHPSQLVVSHPYRFVSNSADAIRIVMPSRGQPLPIDSPAVVVGSLAPADDVVAATTFDLWLLYTQAGTMSQTTRSKTLASNVFHLTLDTVRVPTSVGTRLSLALRAGHPKWGDLPAISTAASVAPTIDLGEIHLTLPPIRHFTLRDAVSKQSIREGCVTCGNQRAIPQTSDGVLSLRCATSSMVDCFAEGYDPKSVNINPGVHHYDVLLSPQTILDVIVNATDVPPGMRLEVTAASRYRVPTAFESACRKNPPGLRFTGASCDRWVDTLGFAIDQPSKLRLSGFLVWGEGDIDQHPRLTIALIDKYGTVAATKEITIVPHAYQQASIELSNSRRRLSVRVTDTDGQPIVGTVLRAGTSVMALLKAYNADKAGRVVLDGFCGSLDHIQVAVPGYTMIERSNSYDAEDDLTFVMARARELCVTTLDRANQPVVVVVMAKDGAGRSWMAQPHSEGQVRFECLPKIPLTITFGNGPPNQDVLVDASVTHLQLIVD
jgi:hypothetical protein